MIFDNRSVTSYSETTFQTFEFHFRIFVCGYRDASDICIYTYISKYMLFFLALRIFFLRMCMYTCEKVRVCRSFAYILFQQSTFCFGVYFSYITHLSVCSIKVYSKREKKE